MGDNNTAIITVLILAFILGLIVGWESKGGIVYELHEREDCVQCHKVKLTSRIIGDQR